MNAREGIWILLICASLSASADPCSIAWKDTGLLEIEIAQLLAEKDRLSGPTAPALRMILDVDIEQKLAALAEKSGTTLNAEQRAQLVELASGKQKSAESATADQKRTLGAGESARLVFWPLFRKKLANQIFSLRLIGGPNDALKGEADAPGVQWTDDERFVLVRSKIASDTMIFDLENQVEVRLDCHLGYLTPGGLWISQPDIKHTLVTDLRTQKVWGPFEGIPTRLYLNDQFVVTTLEAKSQKLRLYRMETGEHLDVRSSIVTGFDWKRIAYESENGEVVVFDTTSWQEVKRIPSAFRWHWNAENQRGFVLYRREGNNRILRLSDFWEIGFGISEAEYRVWGMDDSSFVLKTAEPNYFFQKIDPRNFNLIKGIDDFASGPGNRTFALIVGRNQGNPRTIVFDLESWQRTEIEGEYLKFSADGKWVYRVDKISPTENEIHAREVRGDRQRTIRSRQMDPFHANSEHLLTVDPKSETVYWIRSAASADEAVAFGQKSFGFSPSGKYLLTFEGDDLVILRFNP